MEANGSGSIELDSSILYKCTETSAGTTSYILYHIESVYDGPSEDYILVTETPSSTKILNIGHVTITPASLDQTVINTELERIDTEPLSDEEFKAVNGFYYNFTKEIIKDQFFEGNIEIYKNIVFKRIPDMEEVVVDYFERSKNIEPDVHLSEDRKRKIGMAITNTRDWVDQQKPMRMDTKFGTYKLTKEELKSVPYTEVCQLKATLEFKEYEDWELTVLNYQMDSVFSLLENEKYTVVMHLKALQENGYSKEEIMEKLDLSFEEYLNVKRNLQDIFDKVIWTNNNIQFD